MSTKNQNPDPYLIIARKFRPQTFDDVVGQEPITTTLKNAISKGRTGQSFLFTGSRGVGKTSTARIFAKALNCEKGPRSEPCNACSMCDEITHGVSLDVLEIDGASNRGIDEIRNLRENVKFKPAHGRYKIYVIDEVHMLTGEAFNALLKTLEEPPGHVKFIFATTEAHKVPLTILSRCQRFNFRRISTAEIAKKLRDIAREEKIKMNDQAIFLIAKQAEGSMRDAQSLLDQMASYGEGEVKEADIVFSLGLTPGEVYFSLFEALQNKDARAVVSMVGGVQDQGKDLIQFSRGLLEFFRNLLILQVSAEEHRLIEGTEEEIAQLKRFKDSFSREELLFSLTLLQQLNRDIRWTETPRFLIETCLLKIVSRADLKPIDEILHDLKSFRQGAAGADFSAAPPNTVGRTRPSAEKMADSSFGGKPAVPASPQKKKDDFENGAAPFMASIRDEPSEGRDLSRPCMDDEGSAVDKSEKTRSAASKSPITAAEATAFSRGSEGRPLTLSDVGRVWPDLLERLKAIKMSCGTYLAEAEPLEVQGGLVVFGFPQEFKFHKEALEHQNNKELIRSTLSSLLNSEVRVSFVAAEVIKDVGAGFKPAPTSPPEIPAQDSDIITAALNLFDGSKVIHRDP